jgi:hypothetical protein
LQTEGYMDIQSRWFVWCRFHILTPNH